MKAEINPSYGTERTARKVAVSYGEIERAAFVILKSGRRPTVQSVRDHIGHGSPQSVLSSLNRFWTDLGPRLEGDPAALTRLPSEIADLADGLWQRALALASQAAQQADNGARQRLEEIQIENDLRAQSFTLREKELETTARAREQALADSQAHLVLILKTLRREQAALHARDVRIAALEVEVANYRQQLASLITRAVKHRRLTRAAKPASAPKRPARKARAKQTLVSKAKTKMSRRSGRRGATNPVLRSRR